nr:DUF1990 domain-containing protein [Frondihabitans sucicola]
MGGDHDLEGAGAQRHQGHGRRDSCGRRGRLHARHLRRRGQPLDPADYAAPDGESHFSPEGEPFLTAGTTATLEIRAYGRTTHAPVRVVYVIDEPTRKGFAYGTLEGHPESGEESWVIDQTDDGSVWLTVRAFSRPANWKWRLVSPFLRAQQNKFTQRYLRVLVGD